MRTPTLQSCVFPLLLVPTLVCASEPDLTVPAEVQARLQALLQSVQRPLRTIAKYTAVQELPTGGFLDQTIELETQPNGLVGANALNAMRSNSSSSRALSLNLCGLITLVLTSTNTTDTSGTRVLPVGKLFLPFGMKSSVDSSISVRLIGLDGPTESACSPTPGSTIWFKLDNEVTVKTSGIFGRQTSSRRTEEWKCVAGVATHPATQVNAALTGNALPVQCETKVGDLPPVTYVFSFLSDSQYYLIREIVSSGRPTKLTYPVVQYAERQQ